MYDVTVHSGFRPPDSQAQKRILFRKKPALSVPSAGMRSRLRVRRKMVRYCPPPAICPDKNEYVGVLTPGERAAEKAKHIAPAALETYTITVLARRTAPGVENHHEATLRAALLYPAIGQQPVFHHSLLLLVLHFVTYLNIKNYFKSPSNPPFSKGEATSPPLLKRGPEGI